LRRSNTNLALSQTNSNKTSSKNLTSVNTTNYKNNNNKIKNKILKSNYNNNQNKNINNNDNNLYSDSNKTHINNINNYNNSKTLNFSKSLNVSKLNNLSNNNNDQNTTNSNDLTSKNQNQMHINNLNNQNLRSKQNSTNNLPDLQRSTQKPLQGNLLQTAQNNQIFPASSYHNSSYTKYAGEAENESLLNKSKLENSKIFVTSEILALISNAKNLEKVLSDHSPLTKIEDFERKLQANAKLIESLQGNSSDLLHDKMEMEIKIKEVKGLINQFNDRFIKIDKFLDKGKIKNFNGDFNKTFFDETEYMPNNNSKSFWDSSGKKTAMAQPFSSFKKKNNNNKDFSAEKHLNRTFFHTKNKNFDISSGGKKKSENKSYLNYNDSNNNNYGRKLDKLNERKVELIKKENFELSDKAQIEEFSAEENQRLIKAAVNSKSVINNKNNKNQKNFTQEDFILQNKNERLNQNLTSIEENKMLKPKQKVPKSGSAGSDLNSNPENYNSNSNIKKLVFSREDEEELENLENEIKKIDFDLKVNKVNNNYGNKSNQSEINVNAGCKEEKKNYKKIEINKFFSKKNAAASSREKTKAFNDQKDSDKVENDNENNKYFQNNERTIRSNMRSTKYDSDFNNNNNNNNLINNNKGNLNTTNKSLIEFNNITKIQKILHELESIKNRNSNLNNSNLNCTNSNTNKTNTNTNNNNNNKSNITSKTNKANSNFNSRYNSGNEFFEEEEEEEEEAEDDSESKEDELHSHNKTFYKSNKTYIDPHNSKLINKFFKEEKIAEAIEVWKRLDYGCFKGMSLERSFEMMAQITKIKDKDLEKLMRKSNKFTKVQAESSKKDTEIIELVGEVESLKYKILEMESQIGNYKNYERRIDEIKSENSLLFKENVKLRTLLEQERYFNSYRNQPNFMKK